MDPGSGYTVGDLQNDFGFANIIKQEGNSAKILRSVDLEKIEIPEGYAAIYTIDKVNWRDDGKGWTMVFSPKSIVGKARVGTLLSVEDNGSIFLGWVNKLLRSKSINSFKVNDYNFFVVDNASKKTIGRISDLLHDDPKIASSLLLLPANFERVDQVIETIRELV